MRQAFENLTFVSCTGVGTLHGRVYPPEIQASLSTGTLVQIVHGLGDHMARYDAFCSWLAQNGIAACIHDLPGHGLSIKEGTPAGYFGPAGANLKLIDDLDLMAGLACDRLGSSAPGVQSWRRVLFGHSMGSAIVQVYCSQPGRSLAGAIFSGVIGASRAELTLGRLLARTATLFVGDDHPCGLISRLSYMDYLSRIQGAKTRFDWLTTDDSIVATYVADPYCGFPLSAGGYHDLFSWIGQATAPDWPSRVPRDWPLLVMSGLQDPVGDFGRAPRKTSETLIQSGHDVQLCLYPDGRHEMLNETNYKDVWQNILEWLSQFNEQPGNLTRFAHSSRQTEVPVS
jgi:alpha-beta hydrolase superfamily lysophospholipase